MIYVILPISLLICTDRKLYAVKLDMNALGKVSLTVWHFYCSPFRYDSRCIGMHSVTHDRCPRIDYYFI